MGVVNFYGAAHCYEILSVGCCRDCLQAFVAFFRKMDFDGYGGRVVMIRSVREMGLLLADH